MTKTRAGKVSHVDHGHAVVEPPWTVAGLVETQYLFCLTYIENGFNATQAYLSVHPNVTKETAWVQGCRTLRLPKVASFLADKLEAAWKPLQMGGEQALGRVARLASESPDQRVRLAALRTILEHTGKLKGVGDGLDALAEAIRGDVRDAKSKGLTEED